MKTTLIYLLEANLIFAIGYLYYRFFLSGQRRHLLNRIYLLALPMVSFLFPLLQFSSWGNAPQALGFVQELPAVLIGALPGADSAGSSGLSGLSWLYLGVAGLFLVWSVRRLAHLFIHLGKGQHRRESGYVLVEGTGLGPASFGPFLIWDELPGMDSGSLQLIRNHELAHIRQWHSMDVLFMEVVRALCWFNPAVYQWSRELEQVHEFLADAAASKQGGTPELKRLILANTLGVASLPIANHFSSHTQKRIVMLNKSKSRRSLMAYALALPLMLGLFFSTSMVSAQDGKKLTKSSYEATNDVDQKPRPINMSEVAAKIGYPKKAKDAGLEGKVMVEYILGKKGEIYEVNVVETDHGYFTDAVVAHAEEVRFTPGIKDGKAVKTHVMVPFKFALNKNKEKDSEPGGGE